MEEQGDGTHIGVINAEPPVIPEVDQRGDMERFIFEIALQPLILIGQAVVAFFQRRIWDEDEDRDDSDDNDNDGNIYIIHIGNVVNNGNENVDNNDDVDNNNDHQVEDAGAGAEVDMEVNHHVQEVDGDPLPGVSRRRSREEDAENEESCSKHFREWKEFADSDLEEDPLPGGSRRRSREKDDDDEESTSSKRFRWWDEFASSDSEEDPLPRGSSKRGSNEHDDEV